MEIKNELRGIFAALKKSLPGAETRLLKLLHEREWEVRYEVAKFIGEKAYMPFARRVVDRLAEEPHELVRGALIFACGELRTPDTLNALLTLAAKDRKRRTPERGRILYALCKHASETAREYFEEVFVAELPDPPIPFDHRKEERVLAAWGLMKLGPDDEAQTFLTAMLEDPPIDVLDAIGEVKATDSGVAARAKQALVDVGLMTRRSRLPPPPPPDRGSDRKIKEA
jgi:HEAT repeat protein